MGQTCQHCGVPLRAGSQFCVKCGAAVQRVTPAVTGTPAGNDPSATTVNRSQAPPPAVASATKSRVCALGIELLLIAVFAFVGAPVFVLVFGLFGTLIARMFSVSNYADVVGTMHMAGIPCGSICGGMFGWYLARGRKPGDRKTMLRVGAAPLILALVILLGVGTYFQHKRLTSMDYDISHGDVAALGWMLDHGVKPVQGNCIESPGLTPLMVAASLYDYDENAPKMIQVLLDHGADVNAENTDRVTALAEAAEVDNMQTIRMLLDRGAAVNGVRGDNGVALLRAAYQGRPDAVKLLLDHGANVNLTDSSGATALGEAKSKFSDGYRIRMPGDDDGFRQVISMLEAAGAR